MLTHAAVDDLIAWCIRQNVRVCVLFGSQATGRQHATSDVDLAVWPHSALPPRAMLQWHAQLERLLDHDVSLAIVTPDLDPVLGFEIVRDGKPLYEREPGLWAHHRAQLWHIYCDTEPLRRQERRLLHEFAEATRRGARGSS